jgi:hypothetical protein
MAEAKLCDVCGKFYKPFSSTCERHVVTKTGITFDLEMMENIKNETQPGSS